MNIAAEANISGKPVTEPLWRELREIVWKKYQRKRCPWERVADLDKLLGDAPPAR